MPVKRFIPEETINAVWSAMLGEAIATGSNRIVMRQEEIAKRSNRSVATVAAVIKYLEEHNKIRVERNPGRIGNVYVLLDTRNNETIQRLNIPHKDVEAIYGYIRSIEKENQELRNQLEVMKMLSNLEGDRIVQRLSMGDFDVIIARKVEGEQGAKPKSALPTAKPMTATRPTTHRAAAAKANGPSASINVN